MSNTIFEFKGHSRLKTLRTFGSQARLAFCLLMRESHTDLWILHRLFNLKGSFENSKKKLRDSVSLYSTMPKTSRRQCLVVCNNGESFKRKLRDSVTSCLTMVKAIPYLKKEPFEGGCHPSGLWQQWGQKKWCSLTLESFDNDDLWRRLRKALKFWVLLKTRTLKVLQIRTWGRRQSKWMTVKRP